MKSPILNGLYKHAKTQRIPFNSPGHKGKVTMRTKSLSTLDMYGFTGGINLRELVNQSEDLITAGYKTCRSIYLKNGATGGVYAMLAAYLRRGDKVIVDRECHRSVINAMIIQGLEPVYVKRNYNFNYSISGGVDTDALERTIISNKDAKAVIITSPTFYGVISDIRTISGICHKHGMKLLVDEALGAHLGLCESLPKNAISLGADLSVQSIHKSLGAFGGGALLHIADPDIDFQRVTDMVRMYESASLSPALLCTLENAVMYALENGDMFQRIMEQLLKCKKIITENTAIRWIDSTICGTDSIHSVDPMRIVLNFGHSKTDGYSAADFLRNKANIEIEAANESNVVCLVSIYNSVGDIKKLFHALASLSKIAEVKNVIVDNVEEHTAPEDLDIRLTPEKAFNAGGEFLSAEYAMDRINKRIVYRMPDEVPIILPGEKIKSCHLLEISKIIASGGIVKGLGINNSIEVVNLSESFGL